MEVSVVRPAPRGPFPAVGRTAAGLAAAIGLALMLVAGPLTSAPAAPRKAYVGVFKDNAVAVIDTGAHRVLGTIPVPPGPHGLAITPDGRKVYVSSDGASTVSIIETATDTVVRTVEVGKSPHGLAITPDGREVLVAVNGADQVVMIETATDQIIGRVPLGMPHNIAISPNGRTAYVASQKPDAFALIVVDLPSQSQIGSVALDKAPRALNFSPDGAALYFTLAGVDSLQVLDPKRNQVVAQIPVGASPHHPIVTANGDYGLVVSQGPGELAIFSPATNAVIGTVGVGKLPHWIATTPEGTSAYVTNEGSNSVSVVDLGKRQVIATIAVGNAPRKIVMQAEALTGVRGATTGAARAAAPEGSTVANGRGGIRIAGFAFSPATITVSPGQTVTWTNSDSVPHTTTSADGQWDSGPVTPGAHYSVTFAKPGTYVYGCTIHSYMRATVIVGN